MYLPCDSIRVRIRTAINFNHELFFSPDPFCVRYKLLGSSSHETIFAVSSKLQSPVFFCFIEIVGSARDWLCMWFALHVVWVAPYRYQ